MVIIYASATAAINSPSPSTSSSDTTTLSRSECWAALERICRDPVPHIEQISACRVVHESRDREGYLKGLTRMIKGTDGSKGEVEEVAVLKRPFMIEFEFPKTGSFITSILAPGSGGGGGDEKEGKQLFLTQMYEWHCPEVKEGSREHWDRQAEYFEMARGIVGRVVGEMRKMKEGGMLEGV